jgi:adenosylcobinamide-GDP ribazoletransferase
MTGTGRSLAAALGLFTICPVPARYAGPPPEHVVRWLPGLGVVVGGVAVLPALAVWRGGAQGSPLLAGVLIVAVLATATRGLHLDGLADLADGLGSRRPAADALAVMRQPDIGPFGVATIALTLLIQVASLATILAASTRLEACVLVVVTAVTGRVAVVQAAGTRVPAARLQGFGALVASSVATPERIIVTALLFVGAFAAELGLRGSFDRAGLVAAAVAGGLTAAWLVRRHAVRRLGGVTGDVFGALVEVASSAALLVLATGAVWR